MTIEYHTSLIQATPDEIASKPEPSAADIDDDKSAPLLGKWTVTRVITADDEKKEIEAQREKIKQDDVWSRFIRF